MIKVGPYPLQQAGEVAGGYHHLQARLVAHDRSEALPVRKWSSAITKRSCPRVTEAYPRY